MHPADEGMWKRYSKHPPVQKDATSHFDQAALPCCAVTERLPNKDRRVSDALTTQHCVQTQARLCQALQGPVWDVLQGPRQACANQHDGDLVDAHNHPWPNR